VGVSDAARSRMRLGAQTRTARARSDWVSKVPQVTVLFWVIKVLSTGMGETTSDYLVRSIGPVPAVCAGAVVFVAALALQLSFRQYVVWVYWLAVVMVSVFGTMAADVLHIGLGIPYVVSTVFYSVVLTVVFVAWYRTEHTLSIHSIYTPRREVFYWATVLATFALGTAAGDMTATTLHLGYLASGLLFTALIAIPAVAHWRFGMNAVLAFWFAYVLTRPVGASFADWVAVPPSRHGLDVGYGTVSLVLTAVIVVLVGYLAVTGSDAPGTDGSGNDGSGTDRDGS
jgi:uncharacterized membrane-anchored protein